MRGTDCEREESSRELRNVYRSNLATGLEFRLPIIQAGTNMFLCILCRMMRIAPHVNLRCIQHHDVLFKFTALIEGIRDTIEKVLRGNRE
jgi:hypothetical protein